MLFTELPLELHLEISAYLDKRSLKSLRLAFPRTNTSAAAFSHLYRSFAIRLGAPKWSKARLRSLSALCDRLMDPQCQGADLNPLAAIRTLVIDTRHPYMIKEIDCVQRYLTLQKGTIKLPPYESPAMAARGEITEYQKVIPRPQLDLFVDLIAKVIRVLPLLRNIKWRISSDLPTHIQLGIVMVLCPPMVQRRYSLDVHIDLDPLYGMYAELQGILECLSDLNSLALRAMKPGVLARRGPPGRNPISKLIRRCPNLKSIFIDARVYNCILDPIASALNGIRTLEHIENGVVELCGMLDLKWTNAPNLTKLALIVSRGQEEEYEARDNALNQLLEARHLLQHLRVNAYSDTVSKYLLQDANFIVSLDIECPSASSESLGLKFWSQVIPMHETSLKSLKVYSPVIGVWCWLDYPGNLAKRALSRCCNLEELAICFVEDNCNFLGEMVDNLAVSCPKLSTIDMRFFGEHEAFQRNTDYRAGYQYIMKSGDSLKRALKASFRGSADILDSWKSHNKCFAGRVLQVRYQMVLEKMRCGYRFPDSLGDDAPPPVWFDFMLQTWQIFGHPDRDGRQVYRFGRLDDLYAFDDDLAGAHFGAPVDYYLHF
ncbi:hypothetical protein Dda_5609 [Drechslerella dactyloides]|uniref:F-box domain-containing protein n=1 Tax=Drechslerella dactyloides TaxID=74499 RepID=A0AAD6IYM7_DREDA|nr:hypothetical protein Dda_5609 [Drechslerella dactyloides]